MSENFSPQESSRWSSSGRCPKRRGPVSGLQGGSNPREWIVLHRKWLVWRLALRHFFVPVVVDYLVELVVSLMVKPNSLSFPLSSVFVQNLQCSASEAFAKMQEPWALVACTEVVRNSLVLRLPCFPGNARCQLCYSMLCIWMLLVHPCLSTLLLWCRESRRLLLWRWRIWAMITIKITEARIDSDITLSSMQSVTICYAIAIHFLILNWLPLKRILHPIQCDHPSLERKVVGCHMAGAYPVYCLWTTLDGYRWW